MRCRGRDLDKWEVWVDERARLLDGRKLGEPKPFRGTFITNRTAKSMLMHCAHA